VTFLVLFSIEETTQPRWTVLFTKLLCVSRSSAHTHYTIEVITHGSKTDVLNMTENRGCMVSLRWRDTVLISLSVGCVWLSIMMSKRVQKCTKQATATRW